jgi:hypothetical protein
LVNPNIKDYKMEDLKYNGIIENIKSEEYIPENKVKAFYSEEFKDFTAKEFREMFQKSDEGDWIPNILGNSFIGM